MSKPEYIFADLPNSLLSETNQICVVTRDLDRCVAGFADRLGIGPWWVKTYAPPTLTDLRLRGRAVACSMKIALAWSGATNWEIVEPLEGPTIYDEFLEAQGEGIHHVGFFTQSLGLDWEACHRAFAARGFARLFEGRWEGVRFCYYDTLDPTHTTFEVIHRREGWARPEPDSWYPRAP